jgi:hypothetical protein
MISDIEEVRFCVPFVDGGIVEFALVTDPFVDGGIVEFALVTDPFVDCGAIRFEKGVDPFIGFTNRAAKVLSVPLLAYI